MMQLDLKIILAPRMLFLDACSNLYMRVCPSVVPSVGLSVTRSEYAKTRVFDFGDGWGEGSRAGEGGERVVRGGGGGGEGGRTHLRFGVTKIVSCARACVCVCARACVCVCVHACVGVRFAIARHRDSDVLLISSARVAACACECVHVRACVFVCI